MPLTRELAGLPVDRVVQVSGAAAGDVAQAVAVHSTDLVAVVTTTAAGRATPREFVGAVLEDLERVAVQLLPAWLPEASEIDRVDVGGAAAIRMIAAARAARTRYSGPFLRDLAILAMTGHRDGGPGLPVQARATQLVRLVGESFGRTRCVLLVPVSPDLTAPQRDAMVAGGDWLAHHAKLGVWLLGSRPVDVGRVPVASVTGMPAGPMPFLGEPHPGSAVEALLEAALAAEGWAGGRRWNETYQPGALSAPVRLDLVWHRERCVVELDGPEHCHPVHYEADRQRDVRLQLDGYAVLRFTNARVVHDVGAVVHQIGTYIKGRRDTAKGTRQWPATS